MLLIVLCLDHSIIRLIVFLFDYLLEGTLLNELLLVLLRQLGVDNGALDQAVHLHGTLLVGAVVVFTPRLEPEQSFKAHYLELNGNLKNKPFYWNLKLS